MLSYLKENLQKNNPPENQSIRLIYCPLPQTVAPLKVTIIKDSPIKLQDKPFDPSSPHFIKKK